MTALNASPDIESTTQTWPEIVAALEECRQAQRELREQLDRIEARSAAEKAQRR